MHLLFDPTVLFSGNFTIDIFASVKNAFEIIILHSKELEAT